MRSQLAPRTVCPLLAGKDARAHLAVERVTHRFLRLGVVCILHLLVPLRARALDRDALLLAARSTLLHVARARAFASRHPFRSFSANEGY